MRSIIRKYSRSFTNNTDNQLTKTFSQQDKLPRLPIPEVKDTLKTFLMCMKPHLKNDNELKQLETDLNVFLQKDATSLQNSLLKYSQGKENWMEEIWLNKAYLEGRYPTYINVNWYAQLSDCSIRVNSNKDPQLLRASGILHLMLKKHEMIYKETFPITKSKDEHMCMDQFKNVFSTSRIPKTKKDIIKNQWPNIQKHVIISYKTQLFKINVCDGSGTPIDHCKLYMLMSEIIKYTDDIPQDKLQPNIGVLTTENRDAWAEIRNDMYKSKANKNSFDIIDSSIVVVCLDNHSPENNIDVSHHIFFHNKDGNNRWFDKAIQFIVCKNGLAGFNGEHTPSDAVVPGQIFHEIAAEEKSLDYSKLHNQEYKSLNFEHLKWNINEKIEKSLRDASKQASKVSSQLQSVFLIYERYGADKIKSIKISPDAYIQMILQLAYFRIHKNVCHTYETGTLRKFLKGRTETVRSCSIQSLEFCSLMDSNVSKQKKLEAFKNAIMAHLNYMRMATAGKGVDRHLLGLRYMSPNFSLSFLENEKAKESGSFLLSTSNMSPGTYFSGGFCATAENGYGINYAIDTHKIKMSISGWKNTNSNCLSIRQIISKCLDDVLNLIESNTE